MLAPLAALKEGLADLRVQLDIARSLLDFAETPITDATPAEQFARATHVQQLIRDNSTEFRVHQYRSAIVSIYGHLERFIEDALALAVDRFGSIAANYADLPPRIQREHLQLTVEVLQKRSIPKYQDVIAADDVVARLHGCLSGDAAFSLNSVVFADHSANFRHDIVRSMLERAGCMVRAIDASPGLSEAMEARFAGEERYGVINDLAQRRNEVSHGVNGTTLSIPVLLDYVEIVEAYSVAVMSAVVESLAEYALDHVGIAIGPPDEVFDSSIAGYHSLPVALVVGDVLGYRNGEGRCALSQIASMEVNGDARVKAVPGESVGVATSLRCTTATQLYLLPAGLNDLEGGALEVLT